jgi:hypothetical protein
MAEFTNYLENKLLDHVLRNVTYTSPTTAYVGLFTDAPDDTGAGTEVSGGSYARVSVSVTTASAGAVTSSANVTFPQATGSWGTISHLAIFDALTSGNMLMYTELTTSKVIGNGDIFQISSGNLSVTLD